MRISLFFVLALVSAMITNSGFVSSAHAQYTPSVLVVDVNKVVADSQAGQELAKSVTAQLQNIAAERDRVVAGLREEREKLNNDQSELSAEEKRAKLLELNARSNRLGQDVRRAEIQLRQQSEGTRQLIEAKIQEVSLAVASERGVNMVIDRSAILVMADGFDVSQQVIEGLNEVMPSLPSPEVAN